MKDFAVVFLGAGNGSKTVEYDQLPSDHCQEGEYSRLLMMEDIVLSLYPLSVRKSDYQLVEIEQIHLLICNNF
jgi:hypothetical protein